MFFFKVYMLIYINLIKRGLQHKLHQSDRASRPGAGAPGHTPEHTDKKTHVHDGK